MKRFGSLQGIGRSIAIGMLAGAAIGNLFAAPRPASCEKVVLAGEVSSGQEWKAAFGQGWVFRLLPIQGYSGWDLVVDREPAAGYPDALLLATPPFDSINEREIGTTFGLRAQDSIGWNPRSFRFLTDPNALREGQKLFKVLGVTKHASEAPAPGSQEGMAMQRLLKIGQRSSVGQLRILDAKIAPGVGDAAPYAENWAIRSARTTHTNEAPTGGQASPLGELHWMKFSVTLWLPDGWRAPRELPVLRGTCE